MCTAVDGHAPLLQPGALTDYTTGFLAAFGSLIALQRRALYGGSYLVRVSLSQTGMMLFCSRLTTPSMASSTKVILLER